MTHLAIDLIGTEKAPIPGRESVCPDCNLVRWNASPHTCDRSFPASPTREETTTP